MPGSLNSFADFQRLYGGLWPQSTLGYAVSQFFLNGGSQALVVRVHNGATAAKAVVPAGGLPLIATSEGAWVNGLRARVEFSDLASKLFDLSVKDLVTGTVEVFRKLSIDPKDRRFVATVLAHEFRVGARRWRGAVEHTSRQCRAGRRRRSFCRSYGHGL